MPTITRGVYKAGKASTSVYVVKADRGGQLMHVEKSRNVRKAELRYEDLDVSCEKKQIEIAAEEVAVAYVLSRFEARLLDERERSRRERSPYSQVSRKPDMRACEVKPGRGAFGR